MAIEEMKQRKIVMFLSTHKGSSLFFASNYGHATRYNLHPSFEEQARKSSIRLIYRRQWPPATLPAFHQAVKRQN